MTMRDATGRHGRSASSGMCKAAAAGLVASALLCGASAPLAAAETDMLRLAELSALPDTALDDLRGGFFIGPFFVNFGMKITTMVNDVRVLETSFNVVQPNQIGDVQTTVVQNMPSADQGSGGSSGKATGMPDLPAAQPPATPAATPSLPADPPSKAPAATPNLPAAAPSTGQSGAPTSPPTGTQGTLDLQDLQRGIEVDLGQGTRILQHLDNGLVTQIVNSANGQMIRHATEINLFITNFSTVINQGKLNLGLNNLALESARIGFAFGQ